MTYALTTIYGEAIIPLALEDFAAIVGSRDVLDNITGIERVFDAVMENYQEHEKTILEIASRYLVFSGEADTLLIEARETISRRILNLLSSIRLYQDFLKKRSTKILNPAGTQTLLATLKDGKHHPESYRIVSAFRNFAQHQELPLSGMSFSRGRDATERDNEWRFYTEVIPKFDAIKLSKSRQTPDDLRSILAGMGPQADILHHVRVSIERLGEIQKLFRELSKKPLTEAEKTLQSTIESFDKKVGEKTLVIFATKIDGKTLVEKHQLFPDMFNERKTLAKKNRSQVNMSRRYVRFSNQPKSKK